MNSMTLHEAADRAASLDIVAVTGTLSGRGADAVVVRDRRGRIVDAPAWSAAVDFVTTAADHARDALGAALGDRFAAEIREDEHERYVTVASRQHDGRMTYRNIALGEAA